jgi:carboxyl-terminal processing protease
VKDGLGIEPDLPIEGQSSERLDVLLRQGGQYFRFANDYRSKNQTYPTEALPDKAFAEFETWLAADGFQFETRQLALLAELRGSVPESERIRYADVWKRMEEQLLRLRDDSVDRLAPVVKQSLHEELLSRYVGSKALTEFRLSTDPTVRAARSLVGDPARYSSILTGRP